ncbi:hypothetical protein WR25_10171 [Diploscapter pachys]|uniref:Uncharacterized protein n=1 Tax=Diploscapter pachys TaxID=2018661 RepID=A0A2A2KM40_9BILA|nr:hypothetical protein WR25_10171 [Diploscapter pachys]
MRGFMNPRFVPHGRGYKRGTGGYSRHSAHFPATGSHAVENPDVRDLFKLDLEMIPKPTFSKEVLDLEDGRLQWIHDKLAQFGRLSCRDLFVRLLYDAAEQSETARLLFPSYKAMEEFIDERTLMFEVSRFDEPHTNMLANRGFGDRVGVTRIAQYIRRNDQEGVQTRIQRLYEDLIEPEPTFPFELMFREQFVQRDPADTSDVVPQNSNVNDKELQSRFDDMYLFDSIKHRRFQGKTDFETVKPFFLFYLTKLSNIFVITDQEFISLHPSASSIPSLFLTSLHPKPVSSNKYYHDRSREFLFTNCRVTSTARNYIKVLIEDDPQFEGFFVYVLGHRVSFMGKHMNAEVGIDSRVGFNIINLF